jgi:pyruvate dehydrogenase E2 component (dihydrolipoamide acetyltransferase)
MANIIEMPKLSDTMTVGTLVNWLKKEGDRVVSGDMIAEIETDKATMELESFDEGILLQQMVKPGEQVPCGTPIAAIGEEGEKVDPNALRQKAPPSPETSAPKGEKAKKEEAPTSFEEGAEHPAQYDEAPQAGPAVGSATAPAPAPEPGGRLRISPLARRIAAEQGVALEGIEGSGPGGRILKADVLAAAKGGPASASAAPRAAAAPPAVPAFTGGAGIAEEKTTAVSNMRATIARRLIESKTQIPHFYLEVEIDAEPLLNLRARLNKSLEALPPEQGGGKLSVNDFVLKACAEALRRVPAANASWQNNAIHQHPSADVSFAVAIDEGLITPVIRQTHNKTVRQISAEVKSLAWKAKNKKLKPEEFTGGTFCVSNLGMYGIDRFSAIINPPNAAILAVGATRKVPVVKGDQIVVGQRMSLTLSGDHRVVDGAVGAQFLSALRELLETPALALV